MNEQKPHGVVFLLLFFASLIVVCPTAHADSHRTPLHSSALSFARKVQTGRRLEISQVHQRHLFSLKGVLAVTGSGILKWQRTTNRDAWLNDAWLDHNYGHEFVDDARSGRTWMFYGRVSTLLGDPPWRRFEIFGFARADLNHRPR